MNRALAVRAQVLGIGDSPAYLVAPQVTPEDIRALLTHMDDVTERRLRSVTVPFHLEAYEELPSTNETLPGDGLLLTGDGLLLTGDLGSEDDTFPFSDSYAQITPQGVFLTATGKHTDAVYEGAMLTRTDLENVAALLTVPASGAPSQPAPQSAGSAVLLAPAQPIGGYGEHVEYLAADVNAARLMSLLRLMNLASALELRSVSVPLPVTATDHAEGTLRLSDDALLSRAVPEPLSSVTIRHTFAEVFPTEVYFGALTEEGTLYQSRPITQEDLQGALAALGDSDPDDEQPGLLRVDGTQGKRYVDVHHPVSEYPLLRLHVEPHFLTLPVPGHAVAPTVLGDADGAPGLRMALRTLVDALIGGLHVAQHASDEDLHAALTGTYSISFTA